MRKLRLLLPLLAILLLGPALKATSAQAGKLQESSQFAEYYLGTIDVVVDEFLVLPVDLYVEDQGFGHIVITRAENAINHTPYTAIGTVSGGIVDAYIYLPSGTEYYYGTFY